MSEPELSSAGPAPDVTLLELDGEGVLLDLVQNRYFGLSGRATAIWKHLDSGMTSQQAGAELFEVFGMTEQSAATLVQEYVRQWLTLGLFVEQRSASPSRVRRREDDLPPTSDIWMTEPATASVSDFIRVICASASIRWWIRRRGFVATLERMQSLRPAIRPASKPVRLVAAQGLLRAAFRRGEPDCLLQALGLYAALRRTGHDATICIGLGKLPFRAHAWVECGQVVLTDRLSYVQSFRLALRA